MLKHLFYLISRFYIFALTKNTVICNILITNMLQKCRF